MVEKEMSNKLLLLIGLLAAIVTVLGGELPIGWYKMPETDDLLMALLGGYGNVSTLQLSFGVFFGGIGIALQLFGFEALSRIIGMNGQNPKASRMIHIGALACGFWGPAVHILCIALMYVCRGNDINEIINFAGLIVAPVCIVFLPVYFAMMIVMFIAVFRKKTVLPRFAALLNPAIIMMAVNCIAFFGGNHEIAHSLQMANMGLGSLITFGGVLLLCKKQIQESESSQPAEKMQEYTSGR